MAVKSIGTIRPLLVWLDQATNKDAAAVSTKSTLAEAVLGRSLVAIRGRSDLDLEKFGIGRSASACRRIRNSPTVPGL